MQVFQSFQMPYAALFGIIPPYTKYFALFLAYFSQISYLCTIKHVQLKIQPNATKPKSNNGKNRTCRSLLPLHPTQVRLGETPWAAR